MILAIIMIFMSFNIIMTAGPGEERPIIRRKRAPPPKPQPPRAPNMLQRPRLPEAVVSKPKPQQKADQDAPTVKAQQISQLVRTARETMPYWYRPLYSREEATNFLCSLDPGSFILRDSSTVPGGYALTIKVSLEQVRQRKKMPEGITIIIIVTVAMYIYNSSIATPIWHLSDPILNHYIIILWFKLTHLSLPATI